MTQIFISFFAVVGITLLGVRIFDFFFYRKFRPDLSLLVDLRNTSPEQTIEIFELIALVRLRASGRAAIPELKIILDENDSFTKNLTRRFLCEYHLPSRIYESFEQISRSEQSENTDGIEA